MIKVWMLVVIFGGGWSTTPYSTYAGCTTAASGLSPVVVSEAYCSQIEMLPASDSYAPEIAPLPTRKPGESA